MRLPAWICLPLLLAAVMLAGCSRGRLHQARQLELKGDIAGALRLYQQELSHIPLADVKKRSEVLLRSGECLYRLDRIPEAFASFQAAVEADNSNAVAHLRMGEMFLSAGAPERAREQAMVILDGKTRDNEALALLGAAWAATDNPDLAKAAYERVLATDPTRVTVAVALADIYNREDNVEKAREVLQRASGAQPGSAMPLLATARLEEQEGNGKAAEDAYRRAVAAEDTPETAFRLAQYLQRSGRITEAEQQLRHVDALRRNSPVALGDFQLASGHPFEALDQYRAAMDTNQAPPAKSSFWDRFRKARPDVSKKHGGIASRLIETEIASASEYSGTQRASALRTVRRRLQELRLSLDPATVAILEAELALAENDPGLAGLFANSAVELAPESASAQYVKGLVEAASSHADNARVAWQKALELDSDFNPARLALAEDALVRNDLTTADELVRAVVRDEPGSLRGLLVFARVLLAHSDPEAAAMIAHRASALAPSSAEPVVLFGEASLQQDQIPQALFAFERAVSLDSHSDQAMDGLLNVYRRSGVSYQVLQKMERAAQFPPVSATLLEIAGRLYADHGWYTEAIRALTKVVQIDPKRETAARELARIQLATGDLAEATAAAAHMQGNSAAVLAAYQAQDSGDWQKAIKLYEQAIRAGDSTGTVANNLAWIYAEHRLEMDRALSLADTAASQNPNDPAILDTLGYVLLQRREYSSAIKTLETAATIARVSGVPAQESSRSIRKHLAEAYLSAGDTKSAFLLARNRGPFSMREPMTK